MSQQSLGGTIKWVNQIWRKSWTLGARTKTGAISWVLFILGRIERRDFIESCKFMSKEILFFSALPLFGKFISLILNPKRGSWTETIGFCRFPQISWRCFHYFSGYYYFAKWIILSLITTQTFRKYDDVNKFNFDDLWKSIYCYHKIICQKRYFKTLLAVTAPCKKTGNYSFCIVCT